MQVENMVKFKGQVVKELVEPVSSTLESREEAIAATSRRVACSALRASVDAVTPPRPIFDSGGGVRQRSYGSRTMIKLNSPITMRRTRFRCATIGEFEYPFDAPHFPSHGMTISPGRRVLRLAKLARFAILRDELRCQHDVRLSDTILRKNADWFIPTSRGFQSLGKTVRLRFLRRCAASKLRR